MAPTYRMTEKDWMVLIFRGARLFRMILHISSWKTFKGSLKGGLCPHFYNLVKKTTTRTAHTQYATPAAAAIAETTAHERNRIVLTMEVKSSIELCFRRAPKERGSFGLEATERDDSCNGVRGSADPRKRMAENRCHIVVVTLE